MVLVLVLVLLLDGYKTILLMLTGTSEECVSRPSHARILKVEAQARTRIVIDDYIVVDVELVVKVYNVDLHGGHLRIL
jgi:hypothetical protein